MKYCRQKLKAHKSFAKIIPRAGKNLEETKINNPKSSTNYEKRFKTLQGISIKAMTAPATKKKFPKIETTVDRCQKRIYYLLDNPMS